MGCLLLITCVNVSSLLVARGAAREREIAVRLALGAGRGRIVRQLLVENLLLGLAGGALGVLLASWGLDALPRVLPDDLPSWMQFTLDRSVLAFAVVVALLASVGSGLAPAWQLARLDLNGTLKQGGRSGSATGSGLMRLLVGAELALALVLLTGAGLLVKSFLRLQSVQPGFDAAGVLSFRLALPEAAYPDDAKKRLANQRLLESLQALPGVASAALVSDLPLSDSDWGRGFTLGDRPPPAPGQTPIALNRVVSPDYFATLHIPLQAGRAFDAHDTAGGTPVAIVDETFVRRFFAHANPLGQRIRYGNRPDNPNPWMEIVGVVGDVRHTDLQNSNPGPGLYVPLAQQAASYGAFYALRVATGRPEELIPAVRAAVSAFDRNLAPETLQPMSELLHRATWRDRLLGGIFSGFAGLALLLSALGVYGVTAFATSQRTREFGVRLALGAQPGEVLRLVLRGSARLALISVAGGLALALALTRLLAAELYAVSPFDPVVLAGVTLAILLVAVLASWLPARRATKVDPIIALRAE